MKDEITIRTYHPGDPSLVCYFQYKLYEEQYHFNGFYEKEMLGGMAELYDDLKGSQMWIAELDGKIVGDIAVIKKGPDSARLRWLGVGASLQGLEERSTRAQRRSPLSQYSAGGDRSRNLGGQPRSK